MFVIQLPADSLGREAEDNQSVWAQHARDPDAARGSYLQPGPVLSALNIWGVNHRTEQLCVCVLSVTLPFKLKKNFKEIKYFKKTKQNKTLRGTERCIQRGRPQPQLPSPPRHHDLGPPPLWSIPHV